MRLQHPFRGARAMTLGIICYLLCAGAQADRLITEGSSRSASGILWPVTSTMVWVPEVRIYVAYHSSLPIFFHAGHYFVQDHGKWFTAHAYGNPWGFIDNRLLPRPLRVYHNREWGLYQRKAELCYRQGDSCAHPVFYPERRHAHSYTDFAMLFAAPIQFAARDFVTATRRRAGKSNKTDDSGRRD
ncbi:MAG: hypothetical protein ACYDDO_09455 [Acidiferrobacterales bacterium]